jgi:transcriptional regulator with XRE-family HTH domain
MGDEIGRRVADARRAAQLTQMDLARGVGVRLGLIEDYESGRRPIPIERLERIAKVTGSSTAAILGEAGASSRELLERELADLLERRRGLERLEADLNRQRRVRRERWDDLEAAERALNEEAAALRARQQEQGLVPGGQPQDDGEWEVFDA